MYDIESQTGQTARLYPQGETLFFAQVNVPECWVFEKADSQSSRLSQYTFGEPVRVLAEEGQFSHVQSLRDQYSGWVFSDSLQKRDKSAESASHHTVCITTVHTKPSMKSPIINTLPIDCSVTPIDKKEGYCLIEGLGWVNRKHLCRKEEKFDPISVARAQLGRSYVWGGRGVAGLDCSALSQLCYRFAGRNIPRDSDLQEHFLRVAHQRVEICELERGDLIYLPGHVMIATDAYTVIHANAHHMRVVIEDLRAVLRRSQQEMGERFFVRCYRWRMGQTFQSIFGY